MGNLLTREQTKALIKENNIQTPQDIKETLKGMFKDVIQEILEAEMVSKITDKIIPEIKEWQNRRLEPIYTIVFMDAIHYKVKN